MTKESSVDCRSSLADRVRNNLIPRLLSPTSLLSLNSMNSSDSGESRDSSDGGESRDSSDSGESRDSSDSSDSRSVTALPLLPLLFLPSPLTLE